MKKDTKSEGCKTISTTQKKLEFNEDFVFFNTNIVYLVTYLLYFLSYAYKEITNLLV